MKKIFLFFFLWGTASTVISQDLDGISSSLPEHKHSVATNSFASNWFVQGGVYAATFWSNQEKGLGLSNSLFRDFRSNMGISVAIGKWFTPGLGLRTKMSGVWGRTVNGDKASDNGSKGLMLQEQVLFDLTNMLKGYNPHRCYHFIPYVGGGFVRSMTYNEWGNALSIGLLNTFCISDRFALNLDIAYDVCESKGDGIPSLPTTNASGLDSHDRSLALEIGLTYNLGRKRFEKVLDGSAIRELTQGQIDAMNAQLEDMKAENERLQQELDSYQSEPPATPQE